MRCFALACAMTAIIASVNWAADGPDQQVLSDMGLGGLSVMSDSEALAVRGFGYSPVSASGYGWASVKMKGGSAGSVNKYSSTGRHKAWGQNESEAGVIVTGGGSNGSHGGRGGHGGGKGVVAFSGGSSSAGRK
jgi:hypothetical protein